MLLRADRVGDVQASRALKAGPRAYLLKGLLRKELLETIRAVHRREKRIFPEVAAQLPAFQLLAIPSSQRRRGLVRALQKLQHHSARIRRPPYIVVRQQEDGELCAIERRRGADPSLLEARWFGRGVGEKGRAGEAAAAEPETATAHLMRVPLAGNRIGAHALGRPAAGKAR